MAQFRDVTPPKARIDWKGFISFVMNPVPHVYWIDLQSSATATIFVLTTSLASGIITGLIAKSIVAVVAHAIFSPVLSLLITFLGSLFIYYFLILIDKKTVLLKKVFPLVAMANIPFLILQSLSDLFSAAYIFGFAITCLILCKGLVEIFGTTFQRARNLTIAIFLGVFGIWLTSQAAHYLK